MLSRGFEVESIAAVFSEGEAERARGGSGENGAVCGGPRGRPTGMRGRIKRKQALAAAADYAARRDEMDGLRCALCQRALGTRVEWHHRVPKSRGGVETVPLHPICHRAIHAHVSNQELAVQFADLDELRAREDMQRFLRWVASKPPDFHAPTRQRRE